MFGQLTMNSINHYHPSIDSVDSLGGPSILENNINNNQVPHTAVSVTKDNNSILGGGGMLNNAGNKMISLSKSKEYAKLANQVPSVFNIDKGNKVLNNNDLRKAGIKV